LGITFAVIYTLERKTRRERPGSAANSRERGENHRVTAPRTLTRAARRTIRGLRRGGALEDVDEVVVASVLFSAHQLDTLPADTSPAQVASLFRAHLGALKLLLHRESPDDDGVSEMLAFLHATPLTDAPED
jgi:hypothetical protein